MIDKITFTKRGLTENEIKKIVKTNKLQTNSKAGKVYFDNMNTKNLLDGFYLSIGTNNRLKLIVSLHKYKNMMDGKGFVNYDLFTMQEASEAARQLAKRIGLEPKDLNVYEYEIGLNMYLSKDCKHYLEKIESIGILENIKKLYVNPKYKNERLKTSYFYREMRKIYKVYDKNFEMSDKRRKENTGHPNILRIETVFRRMDKMPLEKFISPENIQNMTDQFYRDWRTINFEPLKVAQKGKTSKTNKLCTEILKKGKDKTLTDAKEQLEQNAITAKQYRRIREFISNWETFKNQLQVIPSEEETEFRSVLKNTMILSNCPN